MWIFRFTHTCNTFTVRHFYKTPLPAAHLLALLNHTIKMPECLISDTDKLINVTDGVITEADFTIAYNADRRRLPGRSI